MENQHKKITGYRDLSQAEIDLMNSIKAHGAGLELLITELRNAGEKIDGRWVNVGQDHLQQGLMALTRAVAQPTSF